VLATEDTMRIEENNYNCLLEFSKPIKRIGIEINQKCNLKCAYCWNQ
jgi:MoaA/NifB/PqqE/SkfB family radical SAM enzyme